jgi:predicted nucleotidyltransferase
MKKSISETVRKYYEKVFNAGIPISNLYVFGSAAKGTMHAASDIDVCVVSPLFGKDSTIERVRLMKLREGISDDIEPHPYSPSEFNMPYDPLASEIKRTGIQVII